MVGEQFDPLFQAAGQKYGIDPLLLKAQAMQESSLNPAAVGPATKYGQAIGIAQMLPSTAKALGVDPTDPASAIEGQARLMAENQARYGTAQDALHAYHGGTNQENWGEKTHDYAQKVLWRYQQLAAQVPEQGAGPQPQVSDKANNLISVLSGEQTQAQPATQAAPQTSDKANAIIQLLQSAPAAPQQTAATSPAPQQTKGSPFGAGVYRGVRDALDTGAEAVAPYIEPPLRKAVAAMGGDPNGNTWRGFLDAKELDKGIRDQYEKDYGNSTTAAIGRGVGNIAGVTTATAAVTPYLAAVAPEAVASFVGGAGGAASKATNAALNGAAGSALLSSTSDVPVEDQAMSGALWGAGLRAALGAAAPIVENIGSKIAEKIIPKAAQESPATIVQQGVAALRAGGANAPAIAENPALSRFTPEQLQRLADYERAGIKNYTLGDITRSFGDQQFERETAKNVAAGGTLRQASLAKNDQLTGAVQGMIDKTGGDADAFTVGQNIKGALKEGASALDSKIRIAYEAAKQAGGDGKSILPVPIMQALTEKRPDFLASTEGTSLLNGFKAKLQQFGAADFSGDKPALKSISVNDAEGIRKWLNNVRDPANTSQGRLVDALKDALDDSVLSAGKGGVYEEARFARQLKGLAYEDPKLVQNLMKMTTRTDEAVDYEHVAHQIVNKSGMNDLKNLRNTLTTPAMAGTEAPKMGEKAWNDLRANVLSGALTQATKYGGANEAGHQIFSGLQFQKALDTVGMDKLKVLYSPEELAMLGAIKRSGVNLTTAVPGAVNTSNTAAAVRNMVEQIYGNSSTKPDGLIAKGLKSAASFILPEGVTKYASAAGDAVQNAAKNRVIVQQAAGAANPQKAMADLLARESALNNNSPVNGINNALAGRLAALIASGNNRPSYGGQP